MKMVGIDKLTLFKKLNPILYGVSPKLRNYIMDYALVRREKVVNISNPILSNVELRISEKCNLRCPMCWWWGNEGVGGNLKQFSHYFPSGHEESI